MSDTPYKRYARERRRWPYVLIAAACVLGALAAWQLLGVPRVSAVTPGPGTYVSEGSLTIVLDVHGLSGLADVQVMLDGEDVTAQSRLDGDQLTLSATGLADGPHAVSFSGASSNLFRREVQKSWRFTVDTAHPTLELDGEADEGHMNTSPATFAGTTEGYATVTVSSGAVQATGTADARGNYAVSADLPDGPSQVTIKTIDRAGNATLKQLDIYVDAVPPTLKVTQLGKTVKHAGLRVRISGRDQLGPPQLAAELDGERVKLSGTASSATFKRKSLAQGRHVLVVSVADRGGNVVRDKQTFVVDSTEHFGSAVLWPGARGDDVRELQRRLEDAGAYSGRKTAVYDRRTKAAVIEFQQNYGMVADGIVGGTTLNALSGQIIVDLGDLRLYLYRDGRLVKSYPVATGQPAYPTPTGTYAIITMTKDPTWLPPDSDWAKEAQPIPPGTENPLGTRWMGTSASGVGIHGTPPSADSSIGTYASHGCIRMHNWDAVDLFDRISIGMRVVIRS
jgi:lipoprotein-anchoring transpeptidase ErfK/SrfK